MGACGSIDVREQAAQAPMAARNRALVVPPVDRTAEAQRIFREAPVLQFTNITYQLLTHVRQSAFGELTGGTERVALCDHVVNKWERAAAGENLPDYDLGGDRGRSTAGAEARQLGLSTAAYSALPAREKMQFSFLDYKKKGKGLAEHGYGRSYFIIDPAKVAADGFIHVGDSAINHFNHSLGAYSAFSARLAQDEEARQLMLKGADGWVEVNLANGIRLPQDIAFLMVDENELADAGRFVAGGVDGAKQKLRAMYGAKVRFVA